MGGEGRCLLRWSHGGNLSGNAHNEYCYRRAHHPRPGLHRGRHLDRRLLQPPTRPRQSRRQIPHRIRNKRSGPDRPACDKGDSVGCEETCCKLCSLRASELGNARTRNSHNPGGIINGESRSAKRTSDLAGPCGCCGLCVSGFLRRSFSLFDRSCLRDSRDNDDVPVGVRDIRIDRVQIIDDLLAGVREPTNLRHCVVAVQEFPTAAKFTVPPLRGDDELCHCCLLLSIASSACRVSAGDTSRV